MPSLHMTSTGLNFADTQTVSTSGTMASELLDHYEEGSWTASMTGSQGAPSAACNSSAHYTKIGNLVYINIRRFQSINVNGASGTLKITGLPFSTGTSWITASLNCYNFPMAQNGNTVLEGYSDYMMGLESHDDAVWTDWGIEADGSTRYMALTGFYNIP